MSSLSLDQLRAAFKQPERSGNTLPNNYYPFWNMKEGEQATVRFLPDGDADNPLGFLVERLAHQLEINGERKTIPCLTMYGEDCPVCAVSKAYYDADDKTNGKKYWRKKSHIAQVLVVEDPLAADETTGETAEGKVKFISLSYQIYNVIKGAFEDGELDEVPFAYENGTNFIVKKTKQGDYPSYSLSKFARSESDLSAEQVEYVSENLSTLSDLLPANPGREKVEAMLEASLTGGDYEEDSQSAPAPAAKAEAAPTPAPAKVEETPAPAEAVSAASEESGDDEGDKILEQIRKRREAKAS